jgi:WD40 repeat protein
LAFSLYGAELATGSHGYTARVWKVADQSPCAHPVVITAGPVVNDVAITRDGNWLATTSWEPEFEAKLWRLTDAVPAAPAAVLQFKDRVFSVAFSPDAHWMAAAA